MDILAGQNRRVLRLLVAVVVLGALAVMGKELVMRAFDPVGTGAAGYPVAVLDLVLNLSIALVVVAAVKAVGTVLVLALLITPAATARLLCQRVVPMIAVSCGIAAISGVVGLALSYDLSVRHGWRLASGATVVVVLTLAFLVVAAATGVRRLRGVSP